MGEDGYARIRQLVFARPLMRLTNKPVILLMGPTAAGKTDFAIKLRERFPVELISVDSALIYKGMDIGTAKPSADELSKAPHRLIDFLDPAESYSAAKFCADARQHIHEIHTQNRIPLLVGGTMMYFNRLINGIADLPDADPQIRSAIEAKADKYGWPHVHSELAKVDPASALKIHQNDPQRIQRALEVFEITGKPMSELSKFNVGQLECPQLRIALSPSDRKVLHQRIAVRFQQMLATNFIDEVQRLYQRDDLHIDLPSIRAVGYRQGWKFLDGAIDKNQLESQGIAATRQLAKRQLTWLRGMSEVNWLDPTASGAYADFEKLVAEFLASHSLN